MFRRRGGQGGFALLMLLGQVFQMGGFSGIPTGTLILVGLNSYIFLQPHSLPWHVQDAAINVYDVWYLKQWKRLFLSAFFHADEWHLYYNMASFLWKGKTLEPTMGTGKFLLLNAIFVGLTNTVFLALKAAWAYIQPEYAFQILHQGAIGYSGVIFALKVLTTYRMRPGTTQPVFGTIMLPARLVVWAELFIISLITPNASFLGHLAGILVGVLYEWCHGDQLLDRLINVVTMRAGPRRRPQPRRREPDNDSGDERFNADFRAAVASSLSDADVNAQSRAREAALARHHQDSGSRHASRSSLRTHHAGTASGATAAGAFGGSSGVGYTLGVGRAGSASRTADGVGGDPVRTVSPPGSASTDGLRHPSSREEEELEVALAASLSQAEVDARQQSGIQTTTAAVNLECDPTVQAAILRSLEEDRGSAASSTYASHPGIGFEGVGTSRERRVQPSAPPPDDL